MTRIVGDKTAEPYQHRIMQQIAEAIAQNRSGAVLAPTGSGKSLLAAAAVEDAIKLTIPVLVLHPDINLLRQNLGQFSKTPSFQKARVSTFIARNEKISEHITRNDFSADVILASNMSLVNKVDDPDFVAGLKSFGQRRGVVIVDEGQKAAAEKLSDVLEIISDAGGMGLVLTATPFRTDGLDPLEPFGASIENDMIGTAEFKEVIASGRIVPTIFDIAASEFENDIGDEARQLIESAFLDLLRSNKSTEQASQGAFARFFKSDAPGPDLAIGDLIVKAVANIWRRRAATSRIAMIHCDSVAFAERLALHLASQILPFGHKRATQHPNVGFVVASETAVYQKGARVSFADLGWTISGARESLLEAARAGQFDILVNVNALGVGTDVPATDLNLLACRARSVGPCMQIAGRGSRFYQDQPQNGKDGEKKTHQNFVDIGSSIYEIYRDIDAMRRGDPECSRRHVRELSADIRRQFEDWFDCDPDLPAKIKKRFDEINLRDPVEAETYIDEIDDSMRDCGTPRPPQPFARGIYIASKAYRAPNAKFFDKTALFVNLEELSILEPPAVETPNPARWLTIVRRSTVKSHDVFLSSTLENAEIFAAFYGISDVLKEDLKGAFDVPTDKQISFVSSLTSDKHIPTWARPAVRKPVSKSTASGSISLLKDREESDKSPFPAAWLSMMESGARHLLSRTLRRFDLEHPIRAIALDRANSMDPEKLRLIAGCAKLRSLLAQVAPTAYERPSTLSVISYDPTIGPAIPELMRRSGARFTIIDNEVNAENICAYLAELIGRARIAAVGPDGDADAWLRTKANLPRKDEAARSREKIFRNQICDLLEPGYVINLTESQLADTIKALSGRPAAPMGTFVAALLKLLPPAQRKQLLETSDQVDKITHIALPIGPLCAGYARSTASGQKEVLNAADNLASFRAKLASYSRTAPAA